MEPSISPVKNRIAWAESLGRVRVRPWDDCPARAVRKMFMCFLFVGLFSPPLQVTN